MPSYSWLTFADAKTQLAQRLYDSGKVFTVDAEIGIYIQQALRMFNALTYTWKTDYVFTPQNLWTNLGAVLDSPRRRTLTDIDMYTQMQYMLLEPASGGTWTGTPQFDISNFAQALQKRRDEVLQVSNCNQQLMPSIALTPNNRRTILPDNVIEVARVRYVPVDSYWGGYGQGGYGGGGPQPPDQGYGSPAQPIGGYGSLGYGQGGYGSITGVRGITLYRDDTVAQEWYQPPLYQLEPGTPQTFMLTSEPPLSWDVDITPSYPGTYEAVVLLAGEPFNPPYNTLLNVPDDFAWVLVWGALSDLLGRESEATDRQRADYCIKRYLDGLNLLIKTPWVMLAKVNGVAVTIDSFVSADRYSSGWDSRPTSYGPFIATGGVDFLAAPLGASIGLTVLGNAPVPVADDDFVQVSRSNWDTVLDLAQMLATFKMGGAEWQAACELEDRAVRACAAENTRLKSTGSFSDILVQRAGALDRDQNRYNTAANPAQMASR